MKIKIFVILLCLLKILKRVQSIPKTDKALFIIYADFESLIEKSDDCKNNFEKSSATK